VKISGSITASLACSLTPSSCRGPGCSHTGHTVQDKDPWTFETQSLLPVGRFVRKIMYCMVYVMLASYISCALMKMILKNFPLFSAVRGEPGAPSALGNWDRKYSWVS